MERQFELAFEVGPFSDPEFEKRDRLEEKYELDFSIRSNVPVVTIVQSGSDVMNAATKALDTLNREGISVIRALEDLVSIKEISDRIGVTRQAVSHWSRGTRLAGQFPAPYVLGETRLWYWPEVVEFCNTQGIQMNEPETFSLPTRQDLQVVNTLIIASHGLLAAGFRHVPTKLAAKVSNLPAAASTQWTLPLASTDFALAS